MSTAFIFLAALAFLYDYPWLALWLAFFAIAMS